jgi:hypothetical protein
MRTRDELIQQIHAEREAWHALLEEVGEDRMEEPGPMGDWTFKDLAAHLHFWDGRTLARLAAGPDGSAPPPPWPDSFGDEDEIEDWDAVNAWIYEQHQERPLGDVLADAERTYERFAELIATMPEEDLMTPGRFEGMGERALVEADFFGHLHEEHEPSLREWLQAR